MRTDGMDLGGRPGEVRVKYGKRKAEDGLRGSEAAEALAGGATARARHKPGRSRSGQKAPAEPPPPVAAPIAAQVACLREALRRPNGLSAAEQQAAEAEVEGASYVE